MDTPQRPSSRSKIRRFTRIALPSLAILLLALGIAYHFWAKDEPPPDLSDIAVARPDPIPDLENGYILLEQAALLLETPEWKDKSKRLTWLSNDDLRDVALLNSLLVQADKTGLWPKVTAALAAPHAQAPWPESADTETLKVGAVRRLIYLMKAKAHHEANKGQTQAALQTVQSMFQVGTLLGNSTSSLIDYLMVTAAKGITLETLRDITTAASCSDDDLRLALKIVREARISNSNTQRVLRMQCLRFSYESQKVKIEELALICDDELPYPFLSKLRVSYKPNKTLRLLAEHIRKTVPLTEKSGTEINASLHPKGTEEPNSFSPENSMGEWLLALHVSSLEKVLQTIIRCDSGFSATEAFLALQMYSNNHDNALPPTLDALVPEYLPQIPIDYADGQPIRYSQKFHALWSVGKNNFAVTQANQKQEAGELIIDIPFAHTP